MIVRDNRVIEKETFIKKIIKWLNTIIQRFRL